MKKHVRRSDTSVQNPPSKASPSKPSNPSKPRASRIASKAANVAPVASTSTKSSSTPIAPTAENTATNDAAERPQSALLDVILELSQEAERDLEARAERAGVSAGILASAYVLHVLGYRPDGAREGAPHPALDALDRLAARLAYPDRAAPDLSADAAPPKSSSRPIASTSTKSSAEHDADREDRAHDAIEAALRDREVLATPEGDARRRAVLARVPPEHRAAVAEVLAPMRPVASLVEQLAHAAEPLEVALCAPEAEQTADVLRTCGKAALTRIRAIQKGARS